ncbi:unnamed protein product, partial [Amoebophrya sp. A25]|eukprot:GSA25T00004983001.1
MTASEHSAFRFCRRIRGQGLASEQQDHPPNSNSSKSDLLGRQEPQGRRVVRKNTPIISRKKPEQHQANNHVQGPGTPAFAPADDSLQLDHDADCGEMDMGDQESEISLLDAATSAAEQNQMNKKNMNNHKQHETSVVSSYMSSP